MTDAPQDAKGIFLAALDVADAAERAAFVDHSCGDDPVLRQRVDELLRAYGQADGPLDKLAAALATTALGQPIREQVGTSIGPYKLMEQIGEGGFGLVFVAEQQQPIRRKVALKIIKPGMDTRDVIARFEAERQALALMDHPNIARVLDAGTTESGRPYFVMELVRGVPITEYCDKYQLTPRERLELFVPVCNAIQHAHLKGIIHRDVKPSNVLVTLHDGKPVVKVIDFGVAKALHQPLTDRTVYTRFAQMIGTPLYMSPEQAEMSSLDIDTRTDVYSLGVLLYELLTGMTPFDKQRLAKAAYDELLKIIREEEPPKPSLRLSHLSGSLPSIAAQRKTEPAKLSKIFHGDLDWITMKALEKDRTRRYETANGFAADVLRYLNDEPVEASSPSAAYRFRKFARKHRGPVTALAALVAVLLLGIAGTTWGLFLARAAERAAGESERKTAEALGQVTQERDAKQTALVTASAERDRAEREFARGLLRSMGFSSGMRDDIGSSEDPYEIELRSFVDWSAIKESRLKLRVLKIAFEDPDIALRVARRSQRVIQACVGMSLARRDQAIDLVSAWQRDASANPKVRVAACWLALELGSADLPAWTEACKYLSELDEHQFDAFITLACSRTDPRQITQMSPVPLIAILESKDPIGKHQCETAADGLLTLASRSALLSIDRVVDNLVASLERSNHIELAVKRLAPLVPRLQMTQTTRAVDALIAFIEKSTDKETQNLALNAAIDGIGEFESRLTSKQVVRAWNALQARLVDHKGSDKTLEMLAGKLDPSSAKRASDDVLSEIEKSTPPQAQYMRVSLLAALAPRLEGTQARRAVDALTAIIDRLSQPEVTERALNALRQLRPRMTSKQTVRAADALFQSLEKPLTPELGAQEVDLLGELAPAIQPSQVTRAWNVAIVISHENESARRRLSHGRAALALRLQESEARRSGDVLIVTLDKTKDPETVRTTTEKIVALAPRLERRKLGSAEEKLLQIFKTTNDQNQELNEGAWESIIELAPWIEPSQARRIWEAAYSSDIIHLDSRRGIDDLPAVVSRFEAQEVRQTAEVLIRKTEKPVSVHDKNGIVIGLLVLAPRLEADQAIRAWHGVITLLQHGVSFERYAGKCLKALAPRLRPEDLLQSVEALVARVKSYGRFFYLAAAISDLWEVAATLEPLKRQQCVLLLLDIFREAQNEIDDKDIDQVVHQIVSFTSSLSPLSREKLSSAAVVRLNLSSAQPYAISFTGGSVERNSDLAASFAWPARSCAKLLSHPGCVGEVREALLMRFEELALYDGRVVFSRRKDQMGAPIVGNEPPRRFHQLHEAASWIQQNWPAFDLETNYPATWFGLR